MLVNGANGDTIWTKEQDPNFFINVADVKKTLDCGFAYVGNIALNNISWSKTVIGFVKTDSLGNTVFTSVFNAETLQPITFYPNPASIEFYINTSAFTTEKKLTITLINMQGKQVLQQEFYKEKAVDVSNLPNGIYVAEVRGKEKVIQDKIIVQH